MFAITNTTKKTTQQRHQGFPSIFITVKQCKPSIFETDPNNKQRINTIINDTHTYTKEKLGEVIYKLFITNSTNLQHPRPLCSYSTYPRVHHTPQEDVCLPFCAGLLSSLRPWWWRLVCWYQIYSRCSKNSLWLFVSLYQNTAPDGPTAVRIPQWVGRPF